MSFSLNDPLHPIFWAPFDLDIGKVTVCSAIRTSREVGPERDFEISKGFLVTVWNIFLILVNFPSLAWCPVQLTLAQLIWNQFIGVQSHNTASNSVASSILDYLWSWPADYKLDVHWTQVYLPVCKNIECLCVCIAMTRYLRLVNSCLKVIFLEPCSLGSLRLRHWQIWSFRSIHFCRRRTPHDWRQNINRNERCMRPIFAHHA